MAIYGQSGKKIDRAKFAAKCYADNFGRRGDSTWKTAFLEVREGQKLHGITDADFEGLDLDTIRAECRMVG